MPANRLQRAPTDRACASIHADVRARVAIIGGGITGLAAARKLVELSPSSEVKLLESGGRLGGVLQSVQRDGFLVECGPDNFITNTPAATDLCRRIGFSDQLTVTNTGLRQAFVVRKGRLCHLPDGFIVMAPSKIWPVIATPILSPLGKLRLAYEYFVPAKSDESDESLASFAKRRFGREVYQRLIQPLVGGIYATNPDRLSLQATLPRFIEMEREHGSLIRGAMRQRSISRPPNGAASGAPYSLFVAPRAGMSAWVAAIAAQLPKGVVQLNASVTNLTRNRLGGWALTLSGEQRAPLQVDAVIVATPARCAADLLAEIDQKISSRLASIPSSSSSIVTLGYRRDQIDHPLDGFGFVVPLVERRKILSGSFSSVKYPGRAPDGTALVRVFVGGPASPGCTELSDEDLVAVATEELAGLIGIRGQPLIRHIARHRAAMPQYVLGHCQNIREIELRVSRLPGLQLAGNAYHGVGIPNCIESGERAAARVVAALRTPSCSHVPQ